MNWKRPGYLSDSASTVVYLPQQKTADGDIYSSETIFVPTDPSLTKTYKLPPSSTNKQKDVLASLVNLVKIAQKLILIGKRKMKVNKKGPGDFVTNIDKGIELLFRDWIYLNFPHSKIIGEEGQKSKISEKDLVWYIDPIDGTTNYIENKHEVTIHICAIKNGVPWISVVGIPNENATLGVSGQYIFSDSPSHMISSDKLMICPDNVVGTEFRESSLVEKISHDKIMDEFNCQHIKFNSIGFSILEMMRGNIQFFYKNNVKLWDIMAPLCLLRESGLFSIELTIPELDLTICPFSNDASFYKHLNDVHKKDCKVGLIIVTPKNMHNCSKKIKQIILDSSI
ncbi:hypothetical protein HOG98_00195 [bacterium]|jgi:myo-inositol-1(or 4)-monophosphatase|nr:hypothetical protein [bacterium]